MPKVDVTYFQERKKYILDCTLQVLSEKPLQQVNMRDIIRKTGFSQGTIYNYYKNIDEIMSVIICQYMRQMKDALADCVKKSQGFKDCYHKICETMMDLHEREPELFEAMMGKIAYRAERTDEHDSLYEIYQVGEELNDLIIAVLKEGIEKGVVKTGINLYVAVFHLWSSIGQTILFSYQKQYYIENQLQLSRREYMEQSFALIIRSVLT